MKSCPLCGYEMDDDATHCERDWTRLGMPPPPAEAQLAPTEQPLPPPFRAPREWGAGFSRESLQVGDRYTLGLFIGLEGYQAGKVVSIKPGATVFGSSMEANVFVFDTDVSPRHCEVRSDGRSWRIVSLSSDDAFLLNGVRGTDQALKSGDRLQIGNEVFVFQTVGAVMLKLWDLVRPEDLPNPALDESTPVATPAIDLSADPLPGKVIDGRYEVLERVGEGGIVVVYKARQIHSGKQLALRFLGAHVAADPSWAARFVNAAAAFARLNNPVWASGSEAVQSHDGLLYQPLELLEGRTLRAVLEAERKLIAERALGIICALCPALGEAHSQGILHRQLKPEKVLLSSRNGIESVKLLGTTVPKLDDPYVPQTRTGIVYGTPCYMSPEQGRGAILGPRSDVYALGVMLYEMLSGRPPFESATPVEVVMRHIKEAPAPLTDVSETVAQVVMKALAKDPNQRQASARELGAECEAALRMMGS